MATALNTLAALETIRTLGRREQQQQQPLSLSHAFTMSPSVAALDHNYGNSKDLDRKPKVPGLVSSVSGNHVMESWHGELMLVC